MTLAALPYIALLGTLFGTSLVASRLCIGQFEPLTYVGLRLSLASLIYLLIYLLAGGRRKWPTDRQLWHHGALLGVFDTALPMTLIILALQYLSSGLASILLTVGPAVTVLLAQLFLPDEPLKPRTLIGLGLAFSGATVLGLRGESGLPNLGRANPLGYLLVGCAMVSGSAMTVYSRKFMRDCDVFQVGSVRMFVAALVVMPLSLALVGFDLSRVEWQGTLALAYATLPGTFLAFLLLFYNIKRFGATPAAMTLYVTPLVAGLAGVLLLQEQITPWMGGGMALILAGIAVLNRRAVAAV